MSAVDSITNQQRKVTAREIRKKGKTDVKSRWEVRKKAAESEKSAINEKEKKNSSERDGNRAKQFAKFTSD